MKVVLKQNVESLGKAGDLVKVADGYARNFLIPKLLAAAATMKNVSRLDHEKRAAESRAAKAKADAAIVDLTDATQRARAEAQASIANAIDQAKQAAAAQSATANAKLEAQITAAEQSIGAARTAAMGALREVATDTANTVINRLTGLTPNSARVDSAVGALLAARGQT